MSVGKVRQIVICGKKFDELLGTIILFSSVFECMLVFFFPGFSFFSCILLSSAVNTGSDCYYYCYKKALFPLHLYFR